MTLISGNFDPRIEAFLNFAEAGLVKIVKVSWKPRNWKNRSVLQID